MSRRFSVTSVLDVTTLNGYYNRLDVFASFTDDGEYDLFAAIDGNLRPVGVFAYPVNDVVGRRSRETTLYARVFRYKTVSNESLEVTKYTMEDYERDYQKLLKLYPEYDEVLDEIYALVPGQLRIKNAFAHLWQLTFRFAVKKTKGLAEIKKEWASLFIEMGYDAVLDKRGTGVISHKRRACILVFGKKAASDDDVEDLEIVSTQVYKKEQNSRIADKILRFNNLTKVSNARNRIKKW